MIRSTDERERALREMLLSAAAAPHFSTARRAANSPRASRRHGDSRAVLDQNHASRRCLSPGYQSRRRLDLDAGPAASRFRSWSLVGIGLAVSSHDNTRFEGDVPTWFVAK